MNKLILSKKIYNENYIEQCIKEFSELSHISIINNKDSCTLVFEDCIYDENTTIKEFENYLIDYSFTKGLE